MRCFYYYFCFIITLIFISSCNFHSNKVDEIFNNVENLIEQFPDSAQLLLDSIHNPYELNKNQQAKYILLTVQAKDKRYKDITSDTLIFECRDYFQKTNDQKNLAFTEFYCGRVFQSQGKIDDAMKKYLEAKITAEKTKNTYLSGLIEFFIGELNYNQQLYDEAISRYKNAIIDFSHFEDKYRNNITSYSCIGNSFLLKESPDSAFLYYKKGLELAKSNRDSIGQIDILQNMGVAFLKIGNLDSAKKITMQALPLSNSNYQRVKLFVNLSKIYDQENVKDSALYYSNLALDLSNNNNSLKTSIYRLLSKIEESSGNYQKSLDYHKQYSKYLSSVLDEKKNFNILEVQKKYDFELLQNANRKLSIERLWIAIISIIVIAIISFIFYRKRTQNKAALLIAKQQIYQLKELVSRKNESINNPTDIKKDSEINDNLHKILFKQLDTFKKISLLEGYLNDAEKEKGKDILKKVNEIMYDSNDRFDWEIFYQPVNALHDNFLIRLANLYPGLDKEDILICCLSKIGFNNTEIALLIKSNQNIIQKKKTNIREVTGMKKQENFVKQLDEIVRKK